MTVALRRVLLALLVFALLVPAAALGSLPSAGVDHWPVANGSVRALAHANGITYLGGDFTRVGPRTGTGAALDAGGTLVPGFPQISGGSVRAAVADGAGGWYVGGLFTSPRAGLVHVRSDGSLDEGFAPDVAGGGVLALALAPAESVDHGTLYIGGTFTRIGGRSRVGLAAIDAATGGRLDWDPAVENKDTNGNAHPVEVDGLAALPAALVTGGNARTVTALVVGGAFSAAGGAPAGNLAALWGVHARDGESVSMLAANGSSANPVRALATGPAKVTATDTYVPVFTSDGAQVQARRLDVPVAGGTVSLNPNGSWPTQSAPAVRALAVSAQGVYAGGDGVLAAYPAVADAETGAPTSTPPALAGGADAPVDALAVDGGRLLVGGEFANVAGQERDHLAALSLAEGQLGDWNPRAAGGSVYALGRSGDRVFAGGDFTSLNASVRRGLAAVDAAGQLTGFAPDLGPDGRAYALATDGDTVWAGGVFAAQRHHLAAFDAISGALRDGFAPEPDGPAPGVLALALREGVLYVGGGFATIGGAPRANLAALDPASGGALGFRADTDQPVRALVAGCGSLFAGGSFESIGGAARERLAELDPGSGAVRGWDPGASSAVYALARGDGVMYAGGQFSTAGGQPRGRLAALSLATGDATAFDPSPDVAVRALALGADALYVGGSFNQAGGAGRSRLAALDPSSGAVLAWDPSPDERIWALDAQPGSLVAGGDFRSAAGSPQQGLARFGGDAGLAGVERCPEPPRATVTAPTVAPVVSTVRTVAPSVKRLKKKRDRIAPRLLLRFRHGVLTVRLSEPATVILRLERRVHRRWRVVKRITLHPRGRTAKVRLRRLPHGRLRLVASARDRAGNASRAVRLTVRR